MPRSKSTTPGYWLHRPTGQAYVRIDGRDHYLGRHGTAESLQAYERTIQEWRAHGQVLGRASEPMTVAALVAAYWEHVEHEGLYVKHGRPTSEQSCIAVALRPLVRLFGEVAATEFGPRDLLTVRQALCSPLPPPAAGEPRRRRVHTGPIVRSSVNKHVHRIRRVFRWAVAMQLVPASCWDALRAVEPLRRGRSPDVRESAKVRPADLRAVVAVLRRVDKPFQAMIRLQWLTGMRPGEVVQMRLGDIERTRDVWTYRPASHKTEHHDLEREIPLGPRAQRVLLPLLTLDPSAWLFPGRRAGKYVREDAYCRAITRACDEGGVGRWTPNQLRHNAATRIRRIEGLDAARIVLGHTDAQTTLVYAEADRAKARAWAAAHG